MHQAGVRAEIANHPATTMEEHHGRKWSCKTWRPNDVNRQFAIRTARDYEMLNLRRRRFEGFSKSGAHPDSHVPGFRNG